MARFQILEGDVSVAFYEASTARDALYHYYADKVKGDLRPLVDAADDGSSAAVTYMGAAVEAVST